MMVRASYMRVVAVGGAAGGSDGWEPWALVTIGPDGTLYGTTALGVEPDV